MTPIELFRELEKLGIEVPRLSVYGEGLAYEPSAGYIHPDDFISLAEKAMETWLQDKCDNGPCSYRITRRYWEDDKTYTWPVVVRRKNELEIVDGYDTKHEALLAACQAVNEGE